MLFEDLFSGADLFGQFYGSGSVVVAPIVNGGFFVWSLSCYSVLCFLLVLQSS